MPKAEHTRGSIAMWRARKLSRILKRRDCSPAVKDHINNVGHCDRCKTVVEPRLSLQWFIKIQPLADKAIAAVKEGHIKFTPEMYEKTYLNWMENIHDWCISRQLWWGHRIPAWHCAVCHKTTVARQDPANCAHCGIRKDHAIDRRAGYVVLFGAAPGFGLWMAAYYRRESGRLRCVLSDAACWSRALTSCFSGWRG